RTMGAAMELWLHADPDAAWGRILEDCKKPEFQRDLGPELVRASAPIPVAQRIPWLLSLSRPELGESHLRQAALRALVPHVERVVVRDMFIQALRSPFFGVRNAAIDALGSLPDPLSRQALTRYYKNATDARQKRTIERLLQGKP
ncbi:MAG: HEAT repeat domain-containing protein, partial [Planctomycetes bacterium]|nr:HEAT repeat domain-containing protein [Planctomycetota bacterium]